MAQASVIDPPLGPRMTLEEWGELPEEVPGELVQGRLVEEEMPDYVHEVVVAWLIRLLGNWGDDREAIVGSSDAKFAVGAERGRKPDVTVFLAGSARPPRRGVIRVAPDIAIEVVSPGARDERRDRVEKMAEYAIFGVRWYWLVDPERRLFEIHGRDEQGRYVLAVQRENGVLAEVPGCPELTIDLNAMWAKADALSEEV